MRIAVYGGSFNPPHPAHVRAARLAYEALQPDKLLIIPAADPPHKQLAEGSPDPQERFELTRIAFRGFPEAEVSDMELVRGGESYTSDTVAELAAEYPGAEIFFVVGTDSPALSAGTTSATYSRSLRWQFCPETRAICRR